MTSQNTRKADPGLQILHLIKGLGRGGAETLLFETRRTAPSDAFIHAYGYLVPEKDALVKPLRELGSEVHCFPLRSFLSFPATVLGLARFLRRSRIGLIHAHLPVSGIVARLAGRCAGVPVVYTEHSLHERHHPVTRVLNLWTWTLQERVVAVSDQVKSSILHHAGSRVPVEVVRNGVAVDRYRIEPQERDRVREELKIADTGLVVGTTAVFRRQKRLEDWLAAARLLAARHSHLHFLLVGDGPMRSRLERRAGELALGDDIEWVGLQEDIRPYLAAMDLYLSSSEFEGLPVAILEAMALELPVVATSVGGVPEVVVGGETGLLVPPRQPEALADAVDTLVTDHELRRRMGRAGRRRVVEKHHIDGMTRRLETIYLEMLSTDSGGRPGGRDR